MSNRSSRKEINEIDENWEKKKATSLINNFTPPPLSLIHLCNHRWGGSRNWLTLIQDEMLNLGLLDIRANDLWCLIFLKEQLSEENVNDI